MNLQQAFDQAYRASQPPEIQALMAMHDSVDVHTVGTIGGGTAVVSGPEPPTQQQITDRATALAQKGFTVDVPIMVWGWDPYLVMQMRQQFGYTWVPSALQPSVPVAPGIGAVGNLPAYDPNKPPQGSILVPPVSELSAPGADVNAFLAKYYPPFDPPPPPPQPIDDPVGMQIMGNLYSAVYGETYQDGARFADARGTFLKHVSITPFGRTNYWEKIA